MKIPKGGLHNINQSSQANINDSWNVLATDENSAVLIAVDKCGTKKTVGDTSNYMRLDGTEEGKPATGTYEFVQSVGSVEYKIILGATGLAFSASDSPNSYTYITKSAFSFDDDATTTSYLASGIITNNSFVNIETSGANPSGLRGASDYSANLTDLDYTQKIYVDNKVWDYVQFNTSATNTYQLGKVYWNEDKGTYNFGLKNGVELQLGQEQHVYGKAYSNISNGQLVMYRTSQGGHVLFEPANFTTISENPDLLIGLATQDITTNEFGYITTFGEVNTLNTSSFLDGDTLYFGSGNVLTKVQPSGSYFIIGRVNRAHSTQGSIFVKPYFNADLQERLNADNLGQIIYDELSIKATPSDNDEIPMYDSVTGEAVTAKYSSFQKRLKVITVTGNITLSEIHNGAILHITNTCNITIPAGLGTDFSCDCYVKGAFIATFINGGVTLNSPSGLLLKTDKMATLYSNASDTLNLLGELVTS